MKRMWLVLLIVFGTGAELGARQDGFRSPNSFLPGGSDGAKNPKDQLPPIRAFGAADLNDLRSPATQPAQTRVAPATSRPATFSDNPTSVPNFDRAVQPALEVHADALSARADSADANEVLLEKFSVTASRSPLPGYPLDLADGLQNSPADRHLDLVRQYWTVYAAWASSLNRQEVLRRLNQIPRPEQAYELSLLNTSRQHAANELLACEMKLAQSQMDLQAMIGNGSSELLPLPADTPIVGAYATQLEWYASQGSLPSRLQRLAAQLPEFERLILQRAQAAQSGEAAFQSAREALANRQMGLVDALQICDQTQELTEAWIADVVAYNLAIKEYALRVVPPNQAAPTLAAMLVMPRKPVQQLESEAFATGQSLDSQVQPVGAFQFSDRSGSSPPDASILNRAPNAARPEVSILNVPLQPQNNSFQNRR